MSADATDWYVVYCFVHYQDGHEEFCHLVTSLEAAIDYINERESEKHSPSADPTDYRVFKLGEEVKLTSSVKRTKRPAPPPKEQNVYAVKKGR